ASVADWAWPTGSRSWRPVASRSTLPSVASRPTTCVGSTRPPWRTGYDLRASQLDRAVEGSPQRAAFQGDAERALLFRAAAPLPLPVRARRRPRASHGGDAGSPLARLHPERTRRARPGVPGLARERLLGEPLGAVGHWLGLLAAADAIYLTVGILTFDAILEA